MAELLMPIEDLFTPDESGANKKNRSIQIHEIIRPIIEKAGKIMQISQTSEANSAVYLLSKASRDIATEWQEILCMRPHHKGSVVAQLLIELGWEGNPPPEFWGTELGQLVFMHHGFPRRPVTPREALFILGCSRQNIYNMISANNRLRQASDHSKDIRRGDVYQHWLRTRTKFNAAAIEEAAALDREERNANVAVITSTLDRKPRRRNRSEED